MQQRSEDGKNWHFRQTLEFRVWSWTGYRELDVPISVRGSEVMQGTWISEASRVNEQLKATLDAEGAFAVPHGYPKSALLTNAIRDSNYGGATVLRNFHL